MSPVHPPDTRRADRRGRATVVLVTSRDAWSAPDHAIEVAWQLTTARADLRILWVADVEDHWFAMHDLRHAGLEGTVEVVDRAGDARAEATVIVRTGYDNGPDTWCERASAGGAPVVQLSDRRTTDGAGLEPFDVERLVGRVLDLVAAGPRSQLTDPGPPT